MKLHELLDFEDPVARGRILRYFWVISIAMLLLGWVTILLLWNN
jgi:hypothetical protein